MGLIPEETVREIRDSADIAQVIGRHVTLKQAGRNLKGLCPFHQEKSPSFSVNRERGFYYCFGCQEKGDVFSFVMQIEGKSFLEAAQELAREFNVVIPETQGPSKPSNRARFLRVNELAQQFYEKQWTTPSGKIAADYLENRGISKHSRIHFALGVAPEGWRNLADHLVQSGVPIKDAIDVGLVVRAKNNTGVYDRFRDRLMCPVMSSRNEVVGFSGRTLSTDPKAGAKYINSPESEIYNKSSLLYGLPQALGAIRKQKSVVLVEGNFDVVMMHQIGIEHCVAPLGTSLTEKQVSKLRRLTSEVVLMYDGDNAGQKATLKSIELMVRAELPCRVAVLEPGDDPDTLARRDPDAAKEMIKKAQPALEHLIYNHWLAGAQSSVDKARTLDKAAAFIGRIDNPTVRDIATQELAAGFGVELNIARRAVARAGGKRSSARPVKSPSASPKQPIDPVQLELIAILVDHPALAEHAKELGLGDLLSDARVKNLYNTIISGESVVSAVTNELSSASIKKVISGTYRNIENPAKSLEDAVIALRHSRMREEMRRLQQAAETARGKGDTSQERQIVQQILTLRKQVETHGSKKN